MGNILDAYEAAVTTARRALSEDPAIQEAVSPDSPADLFRLYMIRFSAHGVKMTESVTSWISRAGDRCVELGREELGRALRAHARSEAGHEKLMENDTRLLVEAWNRSHAAQLDADELLNVPTLYSARKYIQLHEDVIAGPRPYAQIAVEFEIERLSVVVGPQVLARCAQTLDDGGYSFLAEHVELDQGHTAFNERQLSRLLEADDSDLVGLVETGQEALKWYQAFLAECSALAKTDLARANAE
ncbi:MAG TPA: hypothetical protein VGM10_17050 [Actinocrinis sp.]|jgi:hypothetical protein